MDEYYLKQASSATPFLKAQSRQYGSGLGSLVRGLQRFARPFAEKVLIPALKSFGRELLMQGAPELVQVATKRKSPKQAFKQTLRNTVKSQVGRGRQRGRKRRYSKRRSSSKKKKTNRKRLTKSSRGRQKGKKRKASRSINSRTAKRSRIDFFSNFKN